MAHIVRSVTWKTLLAVVGLRHHHKTVLDLTAGDLNHQMLNVLFGLGVVDVVGPDVVDGCGCVLDVVGLIWHPEDAVFLALVII